LLRSRSHASPLIAEICDYIVWYTPNIAKTKYRRLYVGKDLREEICGEFRFVDSESESFRRLTKDEVENSEGIDKTKLFRTNSAVSPGVRANTTGAFEYNGMKFDLDRIEIGRR
jgi:adenine-specific DNA-methyltransferase